MTEHSDTRDNQQQATESDTAGAVNVITGDVTGIVIQTTGDVHGGIDLSDRPGRR